MKIEVGKNYRTREGTKARCVAMDGSPENPYVFVISGFGSFAQSRVGLDAFVQSEWVEKPEVNWTAMPEWAKAVFLASSGQAWVWSSEAPVEHHLGWRIDAGNWNIIPQRFAPTWTGRWQDSLVTRP